MERADRVWSWVATAEEREDRRRHASRLVGRQLRSVRYVDIDYQRERWADGVDGPRLIKDARDWRQPPWRRQESCHCIDFGVEIETTDGRVFTVTWDPPGMQEGLGIREIAAVGYVCREDADVAVWDVTARSRWNRFLRRDITEVVLHYRPWTEEGGFWCPRITLRFGGADVELLLAEADYRTGELRPSANAVAVLFAPDQLPAWHQTEF
jgi:hypothetical protein